MIESIKIESDEDGFHLILVGDLHSVGTHWRVTEQGYEADHRLSQQAAWDLVDAVQSIAEWRAEGEAQKANVAAGLDHEGRPLDPDTGIPISGWGIDHDRSHPEQAREMADLERKRRKENP